MSSVAPVLDQLHRLGDREKGYRFEQLCAWLLQSEPAFPVRRAYRWNEWRERRLTRDGVDVGLDTGIDIVAETDDGGLWAVQCKCYAETSRVSTDDIDSFIACAATGEFAHLLLIASTDKVADVGLAKLLRARRPSASLLRLEDLRALERDDWPTLEERIRPAVRRPQKLRPHQLTAMLDVVDEGFFADDAPDRGQLLMACGSGKTLVAQRVCEKLRCERTLVVVPSLSLLEQTHRCWKANATRQFDAFCFCSDPSVARQQGEESDRDVATIAVPVHTDPGRLIEFLSAEDRRVVVFATYQSLERLSEVFVGQQCAEPFDLLVADEAHRSAGRASSSFALVCDTQRLRAARRLFMTATARVVTGSADDDLVLSMDDESRYGRVFHRLSFSNAIEQGLLCDYQVLVIAADPGEQLAIARDRRFVRTPEHDSVPADALAVQLAVLRAMQRQRLRRVVSFHSRVRGAKEFARGLPATLRWRGEPRGRLWTQAVSGAMPAGHRRMFLRRLERLDECDRALISNARCFGEGVDVPAIDAVVFVDPRESIIDIVQAVGRTMRRSPQTGKQQGTIVVPVLTDGSDPDEVLSSSAFQTVWKVLGAMRSHDDRLDDELHALLQAQVRGRSRRRGVGRVSFDLPSIAVGREFAEAFTVKAVEITSDWFERGLAELAAHIERGGAMTRLPRDYTTLTGFRLGTWCHARRNDRREGKLNGERIGALDALGFVWEPNQEAYERGLAELTAYIEENGSARMPTDHATDSGFELGVWCGIRRTQRKTGQLSPERIAELDALGFIWDQLQHEFDRGLTELGAYVEENGDARVPQGFVTPTDFKLGTWCGERRKQRKQGRLPTERVEALDRLGFVWDPLQEVYDRGLAELRTYVETNGTARVPDGYRTQDGFGLANWCGARRRERKQGQLSAKRVRELDALGFVWDPLQGAHDRGLEELAAYVAEAGTAKVPGGHLTASGFSLGRWCGAQRQELRKGRLSEERREALDALGFVWDPFQEGFDLGMAELTEYVARHGDANVPSNYQSPSGFNLGKWCGHRRRERNRGRLSAERVSSLEALGFVWEPAEDAFDRGLSELAAYVQVNGTAKVTAGHRTASGFSLGAWCRARRKDKTAGALSAEQVAALDALGFVWAPHQQAFERGLAELAEYVETHRSARVPDAHKTATGFALGAWCQARRSDIRAGRLPAERVAALEALGFEASPPAAFDRGIAELTEYVRRYGDAHVPTSYQTDAGFNLGKWCSHRRNDRRTGRLSPDRERELEALGFVWNAVQDRFDVGLGELTAYIKGNGDARVPQAYRTPSGFKLGAWCSERRTDRRLGRLAIERIRALDALGFVWNRFEDAFNQGLAELATYVAEIGDAYVPHEYKTSTGFNLGTWCSARRSDRKRGQLSPERVAALDALGFVWETKTAPRTASLPDAQKSDA